MVESKCTKAKIISSSVQVHKSMFFEMQDLMVAHLLYLITNLLSVI